MRYEACLRESDVANIVSPDVLFGTDTFYITHGIEVSPDMVPAIPIPQELLIRAKQNGFTLMALPMRAEGCFQMEWVLVSRFFPSDPQKWHLVDQMKAVGKQLQMMLGKTLPKSINDAIIAFESVDRDIQVQELVQTSFFHLCVPYVEDIKYYFRAMRARGFVFPFSEATGIWSRSLEYPVGGKEERLSVYIAADPPSEVGHLLLLPKDTFARDCEALLMLNSARFCE